MQLELRRPLVFTDIESTGPSAVDDQIVELSMIKLMPDGERIVRTKRMRPDILISPSATAVHGISNEAVAAENSFRHYANAILDFIYGCDLAGFRSNNFDFPMLYKEFLRAGINWDYQAHSFVDVGNLFVIQEPRTLTAAVKFYLGKELEGAHGAQADISATLDVLLAQMNLYPELPKDIPALALKTNYDKRMLDLSGKFTYSADGEVLINFGKHMGQKAEDNKSYLQWMLTANFSPDTIDICNRILLYQPS